MDITGLLSNLQEARTISDPIDRDTQVIWHFNYIAEELSRWQDPRAEYYLDTLDQLSLRSNWPCGRAFYHRGMGRYHDFRGDYPEAIHHYNRAIELFKERPTNLRELAFTYVLNGFLLSNSGLHKECWKKLEEGLPYARAAMGKNSLCLMLDWFGDYYYYGLDGVVDNQKALDYYLQVQKILPQISYSRIIADNYAVIAGIYYRLGQNIRADSFYNKAYSISTKEGLWHVLNGMLNDKAKALTDKGDHLGANDALLEAAKFMDNSKNIEFKARLEQALYENYKNLGQMEKALEHHENWWEMEAQMETDQLAIEYKELEGKYELANKEKTISELQQSKMRSNRNLLLALLGLLIIGGGILYQRNRRLAESLVQLDKKNDEVKSAIYMGETQERQRIAAELHDNVNTKLAAARWRLEAVTDEVAGPAKQILEDTVTMMNDAYDDVRNISHNLVPAQLAEHGLVKSVENLIDNINSGGRTQFNLSADQIDENKIQQVVYPLYNVIFELINNVLKHAEAEVCEIRLYNHDDTLITEITDNGKGYDPDSVSAGFGLRSISNRLAVLDGKITVMRQDRGGIQSKVVIPVT